MNSVSKYVKDWGTIRYKLFQKVGHKLMRVVGDGVCRNVSTGLSMSRTMEEVNEQSKRQNSNDKKWNL